MKNQRAAAKLAVFLLMALAAFCFYPGGAQAEAAGGGGGAGWTVGAGGAGGGEAVKVAQWVGEFWVEPDKGTDEDVDGEDDADFDEFDDEFDEEFDDETTIADPLEPFNRAVFVFNDKLYFWFLKPVARGYGFVVPEPGRVAINRFFTNLYTPVRFVNSILQLKFKHAGTELLRFGLNSTLGVAGLLDPARDEFGVFIHKEDLGQTFGRYGAGPGFFLNLPIIGPSSARDALGRAGDVFLNPLTYIFYNENLVGVAVDAGDRFNNTSLNIGVYEGLKADALDPYTFIRDAYHQHRENLIRE